MSSKRDQDVFCEHNETKLFERKGPSNSGGISTLIEHRAYYYCPLHSYEYEGGCFDICPDCWHEASVRDAAESRMRRVGELTEALRRAGNAEALLGVWERHVSRNP